MLKNTIAREYHRQSAGMYLLILLAAFGFVRGEEHVQLASLIMSRMELLIMVIITWGLHVLKTSLFFVKIMQQPSYEFLFDVALLPKKKKWTELVSLQISLNAIFLSYATFMLLIGIRQGDWASAGILIVANLIYIMLPVLWKHKSLQYPAAFNHKITFLGFRFPQLPLSKWLFFPLFLLNKEPVYLILQKLFAAVMIAGMAYFYPTDDYDERLLKLGLFLVASGYFTLTQHFTNYYNSGLLFTRNLPIGIERIFAGYIVNGVLFTLPELLLFVSYLPDNISPFVILDVYIYIIAAAVFWQTTTFWIDMQNTRLHLFLFIGHITLVIILMFKIPLVLLAAALLLISFWQFRRHYYNFETAED
jgi:hypothetical protein